MRWKISVLLIAAMLCVALTGVAAAEDIKCCWEKPCGTKVLQDDNETVFVLYPIDAQFIELDEGSGYIYVDMTPDDEGYVIGKGDVRLTGYHEEYPPNSKVEFGDNDNTLSASPLEEQDIITYMDIDNDGKYTLYDPVYIDLDDSGDVSTNDIRITDVPPVDVYYTTGLMAGELMFTAGEWGEYKWTQVIGNQLTEEDLGMTLTHIGADVDEDDDDYAGYAWDLLGWVDGDCTGDWDNIDKLYINQPTDEPQFDHFVTIGDVRLFVPVDNPYLDCGTKVQQGDMDAVYALMVDTDARLAYYTYGEDEVYIDMDDDYKVSIGDVRLTSVSNHYEPNTKVKISDQWDLNHELTHFDNQERIMFYDLDGLEGYSLGDPLYINMDEDDEVSKGDIRLSDVPVFDMDGMAAGSIGQAWSVVQGGLNPDYDVGWELDCLPDIGGGDATVNDLLGYIDSDCSGDWTCVDKLYLQQLIERGYYDVPDDFEMNDPWGMQPFNLFVTVGDHRLYIPENATINEGWPLCGTKVIKCDIDVVFALNTPMNMEAGDYGYIMAGFVERGSGTGTEQGFNMEDFAYLDMDGDGYVSDGDVRLTYVEISGISYEPNTKVKAPHDKDLGQELIFNSGFDYWWPDGDFPFGFLMFMDINENGVYDVEDPLYLDGDAMGPGTEAEWFLWWVTYTPTITSGDIRLTDVPIVDGPYGAAGSIGEAWSRVGSNDEDTSNMNFATYLGSNEDTLIGDYIMIFDADCSGSWTCVDALYLQQDVDWGVWPYTDIPEMPYGLSARLPNFRATAGDLRLYIPPCDGNSTSTTPEVETFDPMVYDTQNPFGEIEKAEVFNAIADYLFNGTITKDDVYAVIGKYLFG